MAGHIQGLTGPGLTFFSWNYLHVQNLVLSQKTEVTLVMYETLKGTAKHI